MADKKISALTAATTPLAGTEVLPIVQSSATVKVSVDNLTTGKTVPVGSLSVSGSQPRITADMSNATQTNRLFFQNSVANASTSVGVMPSGSGTSSRLNLFNGSDPDNAGYLQAQISATNAIFNSAKIGTGTALPYVWQIGSVTYLGLGTTGDLTVSSGNLVQGTAAKGVNFTANTPAAGMTSQLLNWYEEGTWTPTLGGSTADPTGVSYAAQTGRYTRVGRTVTVSGLLGFTTYTGGTGNAIVRGLPFTVNATVSGIGGVILEQITFSAGYTSVASRATSGTAFVDVMQSGTGVGWTPLPLANAASSATGKYIQFTVTYEV